MVVHQPLTLRQSTDSPIQVLFTEQKSAQSLLDNTFHEFQLFSTYITSYLLRPTTIIHRLFHYQPEKKWLDSSSLSARLVADYHPNTHDTDQNTSIDKTWALLTSIKIASSFDPFAACLRAVRHSALQQQRCCRYRGWRVSQHREGEFAHQHPYR